MITHEKEYINTRQLASILGDIKPATIHKNLCLKGNYLGLVPIRLSNGRLLWRKGDIAKSITGNQFAVNETK